MDDTISRQAAIDALHDEIVRRRISEDTNDDGTLDEFDTEAILRQLPSTQQDCADCPEYDHKTHSCPKYCDVIRKTLEEAKQERTGRWIPCTKNGLPLSEMAYREGQKWYGYKCSNCNSIYKGNALIESPYCKKCGARMEENNETD